MTEMKLNSNSFKTALDLLINPQVVGSSATERAALDRLLTKLNDPVKGVDACLDEFRAVYKPAAGPTSSRDLFLVLRDNFQFAFPELSTWSSPRAQHDLYGLHQILYHLVLQVTNLFTLSSAMLTAEENKIGMQSENNGKNLNGTFAEGHQMNTYVSVCVICQLL